MGYTHITLGGQCLSPPQGLGKQVWPNLELQLQFLEYDDVMMSLSLSMCRQGGLLKVLIAWMEDCSLPQVPNPFCWASEVRGIHSLEM